jgi:chromosome segregation ATPase
MGIVGYRSGDYQGARAVSFFKAMDFLDFECAQVTLSVREGLAKHANAKRDAELERMSSALRDLKDHSVKQQGEIERLREHIRINDRNWKEGLEARGRLGQENVRLVAEGNELRDKLTATNALVSALREALERCADYYDAYVCAVETNQCCNVDFHETVGAARAALEGK